MRRIGGGFGERGEGRGAGGEEQVGAAITCRKRRTQSPGNAMQLSPFVIPSPFCNFLGIQGGVKIAKSTQEKN